MRTFILLALVATVPLAAGCSSTGRNTESGALLGAAIGAGAGAIVGHQSGDRGPGAAIGAGLGALAGGLIGNALDRSEDRAIAAEEALHEEARADRALSILDVIRLSQSGVSDRVIIAKIAQSGSTYDLSAAEIIDLKRSSVSEAVIEHMLQTGGQQYRAVYQEPQIRTVYRYSDWSPLIPRIHLHGGYYYHR